MPDSKLCSLRELYVLGGLDEAEAKQFETHLQHCHDCQQEMESLKEITDMMLYDFEDTAPPVGMRNRVLQHVFEEEDTDVTSEIQSHPSVETKMQDDSLDFVAEDTVHKLKDMAPNKRISSTTRKIRFRYLYGAAAAIVLIGIWVGTIYRPSGNQKTPLGNIVQTTILQPISIRAKANLIVTSSDNERQMFIHFSGLKPTHGSEVYQVWLIKGPNSPPYSMGVFTPDNQGKAVFASMMQGASHGTVAVTLEPQANDTKPLGTKVFQGNI